VPERRRRRRHRSHRRRPQSRFETRLRYLNASGVFRRRLLWGFAGLCVLGVLWVVVTGLLARQQVTKLEDRLLVVKQLVAQGRIDDAHKAAQGIPTLSKRAHLLTTGPAWWTAAHVPWAGDPLEVMRGVATAGNRVGAHGISALLDVATQLDPTKLRSSGDTVQVAPLIKAAPTLRREATTLDAAIASMDRLPASTWFGPVDRARVGMSSQLRLITGYVDAAANVSGILPTMLGANSPQRYFVGLQNEAEMRGTGGLPGAFAIVVADKGKITFTHFLSDAALLPPGSQQVPTGLDFGEGFNAAYGNNDPTSFIVNSNMSPHFPYAARVWAAMWQKVSGEKVDGAVAVDPTTLSYFLAVTGPVVVPQSTYVSSPLPVGADNIVSLTEKDEYALFPPNANNERKDFLVAILKAASNKLTSGSGRALELAHAMTKSSNENRLMVWSADPSIQKTIETTSYSGAVPKSSRPFGGMILNNTAAGKLDYYLARSMDYRRIGCGSTRDVVVTLKLANLAPPLGLPQYVVGRIDHHDYPVQPGDNRVLLDYYATPGAQLLSATLNDKPTTVAVLEDLGKKIFRSDMELPRGTTQTLVLHLQEPAGTGSPQIWKQPGVTPLQVKVYDQNCR
jgi:hypothetical protein